MDNNSHHNSIYKQVGFGLTAFAHTGIYALCFASTVGQGLVLSYICCIVCAILSIKHNQSVFTPHPLFITPLIFVYATTASPLAMVISIILGAVLYLISNKFFKKIKFSPFIISGCALGLCVASTILLTNIYFGIGAEGATPLEMLKSYRSLGFHPHFMGLLTGTITLFTTITYPFKFKKLSKIIPTPLVCIGIPYILNLFLNPVEKYTTINEATSLDGLTANLSLSGDLLNYSQIIPIIKTSLVLCVMFIAFSQIYENHEKNYTGVCNILSCFPVVKHSLNGYTWVSALTFALVSVALFLFCPAVFSRTPLHSIGAFLIVSAWQSLPYKQLASAFKENKILALTVSIVCVVAFIVTDVFIATFAVIFALCKLTKEAK